MEPQKIAQRKRAVHVADAVNKIEGVTGSQLCDRAFKRMV